MASKITFKEQQGAFTEACEYVIDTETGEWLPTEKTSHGSSLKHLERFRIILRDTFLPFGFPTSVSDDYVEYQAWDTVQALASSITGSLATEAVMKGVGVGDDQATPLAAAITWLIKSGMGHVGRITFAYLKGNSLDHDCKKWRLIADILNDIATVGDMLIPFVPSQITMTMICLSSIVRSIVGVAGGATRAAVTQHQARNNNVADVSAKDGTQETLVNLLGLILSLLILPLVSGNIMLLWAFFILLTFCHIFANYKAVKALKFQTFNASRLSFCLDSYLKFGKVCSVHQANSLEKIFPELFGSSSECKIELGISSQCIRRYDNTALKNMIQAIQDSHSSSFLIIPSIKINKIFILLSTSATHEEMLEAYSRALISASSIKSYRGDPKLKNQDELILSPMDPAVTKQWKEFHQQCLSAGNLTFPDSPIQYEKV